MSSSSRIDVVAAFLSSQRSLKRFRNSIGSIFSLAPWRPGGLQVFSD
jgi:hypothetical protein